MRAFLYPSLPLKVGETFEITSDKARHLIKVLRIKSEEKLLLLDGNGGVYQTKILEIKKNVVTILIEDYRLEERQTKIDLSIGITKKDALESILKKVVELGIKKLIPTYTQFSQRDFSFSQRHERIIESAINQSNNPYILEIDQSIELTNIPFDDYEQIVCFSNELWGIQEEYKKLSTSLNTLVLIGPEGGFAKEEIEFLRTKSSSFISLKTPILRSETAVCVAMGTVLNLFK